MSAAEPLNVEAIQRLGAGHGRLRVHIDLPPGLMAPARFTAREILTRTSGKVVGRVGARGPVTDIVGTYWGSPRLMSERLVSFLADHDVTGWRAVPVELENNPALGPLWLLVVTGRAGPVYGVDEKHREGLPAFGYFLDPAEWDGSDLFVPANTSEILVAAPCAALLKKARFRNLRLEPASLETKPHS